MATNVIPIAFAGDVPIISIAQPPRMRDAVELAMLVATRSTTVLLLGETGSGKGLLARKIHDRSPRAGHPYVELNCAGLSHELTESELFGHEKGAFTGATERKQGLFEIADGGTLLLDEIGEMDLAVQAKLLKVLETRRFRRVGGTTEIEGDVRVIAATHRDLAALVEDRRFRSDLFYRLEVFPIRVPPLRDRIDDILPLARELLAGYSHHAGLSRDAERALVTHDWPGNVRELCNAIERATIMCPPGEPIRAMHLQRATSSSGSRSPESSLAEIEDARDGLDARERRVISEALRAHGGVVARAARALGVARTTLVSRIARLGLDV